jgi:ABC-type Mn2+/Zn2+ transport system permease subunit
MMEAFTVAAVSSAVVAALLLGVVSGLLGTFVVVRRMALTGDMISHAVLPGIVAGLAWSTTRNPLVVLGCAVAAGVIGSLTLTTILRHTKLKGDAALALVLSVFFAFGIAMISRLQPAGVQAFLYGQVAAIDRADLILLTVVTLFTAILLPLLFRVMGVVSFDPAFSRLMGLPVKWIEIGFFLLLTIVIVIAMQAVGVVLVTAMLVTPAAAARFCTASLSRIALLSCIFGAAGGMMGVIISAQGEGLPTGPLMALSVTAIFLGTTLFGKRSGWIPTLLRRRREQIRIVGEDILKRLWQREELLGQEVSLPTAEFRQSIYGNVGAAICKLTASHWIVINEYKVSLTPTGRKLAASLVRAHRLWERYLTERASFKPDHVHESAERAEHWLDEEGRRRLEIRLGRQELDPHGSRIPNEDEGKETQT